LTQPSTNGGTPASSGRTPAQGNRLDPWYDVYADRAHNLRASEIRALFSVVSRPEVVSLAGGMPNLKDLPLDKLAASAEKLIRNHGAQAMQYGSGQGWEVLRERITEVMAYDGIVGADPDDVVVTTGSQQALDLVTELFVNPGFIYIIPNYHNPAGVTLSAERRPIIAEICLREHVLIVEDNPYGLLGFHNDPLPAIASYSPEGVVYLGSFSKMFAPGFRIGWAYAPHAIRAKLVLALESAILCPSMVGQMAIADYLSNYDWYGQVKSFRSMYAERCRTMLTSLEEYMPSCTWTVPDGGFYTWVTLPEGLDAKAMLPRAVRAQVAYVSGTAFFYDGSGSNHLRLSFCYPTPKEIREGVRRLSTVVNAEKEIVDMFGTASGNEAGAGSDR